MPLPINIGTSQQSYYAHYGWGDNGNLTLRKAKAKKQKKTGGLTQYEQESFGAGQTVSPGAG